MVRRKKPTYEHGEMHKKFDNLLNENLKASGINQKWPTDFSYLFLTRGDVKYNFTIINLYDRSVVAIITDRHITSELAIRILQQTLDSQAYISRDIILHSDHGKQYTSKSFTKVCKKNDIKQSRNKSRYPYNNAPMERYFNTLKNK
ncbi:DDE-type integrase/transposase/recombinase [Lachnoanaerobaculum sp.]